MLDLPFESWYNAIESRRSRRTFIPKSVEEEAINSLNDIINKLNKKYKGVSLKLVETPPDEILSGITGPYGKITGAPAYIIVMVSHVDDDYLIERGGYIGQAIALEATVQGLSTCWVSGLFADEVVAVLPIGYARKNFSLTEKMMSKVEDFQKRKSIDELVSGLPLEEWPQWIEAAIHKAQFAPSAYNRQPVCYEIGHESITITLENLEEETNVPKQLDRGIAMLHIDLTLKHHDIEGKWYYSDCKSEVIFQKK